MDSFNWDNGTCPGQPTIKLIFISKIAQNYRHHLKALDHLFS